MNSTPSRRRFLGTGASLLALPWLESLAKAGEAEPPRRMVVICTGFGLYGPSFFPTKAGRDYDASDYLKVLGDLREQFTIFSGISHPEIGGDHASEACFLTGAKHPTSSNFRNTVSLDTVAANRLPASLNYGNSSANSRNDLRRAPRHLLTYATGTRSTVLDQRGIDRAVKAASASDYGVRAIIHAIIQSDEFRYK